MPTMGDLVDLLAKARKAVELFGAEGDWHTQYKLRTRKMGDAILEDFKLTEPEARDIPHDAKLGPRSTHQFDILKTWLADSARTEI